MYEPVATFIQGKTESFIEGELLRVTQEMGLDVNREELLKALQYDRGQYEKGYADGCRDSRKLGEWLVEAYTEDDRIVVIPYKKHQHDEPFCSRCKSHALTICGEYVTSNYCHNCGAKMDGGEEDGSE